MRFGVRLCALAFSVMLCIPTAAADEEDDEIIMLEEIMVTARKREQRSFEVPLSVSTLRGEKADALRSSGWTYVTCRTAHPVCRWNPRLGASFRAFIYAA